ncbi:MAG: hypothetical protein ABIZ52_05465 [Candidatus Limnocylindrales bacterium]
MGISAGRRHGPAPAPQLPSTRTVQKGLTVSRDLDPVLRLQGLAGNRAVVQMLATHAGASAMGATARKPVQRRPTAADRKRRSRAAGLKAADARSLIAASLPFAAGQITADQIAQMQRVLDAAVVNPEVKREAAALDKKAVIAESGGYQNLDQSVVRRADRKREEFTAVQDSDKRIRLNAKALLARDALTPTTDNKDEVTYLNRVGNTLTNKGVWLRFEPKLVRNPEEPSTWMIDPRQFQVWLSLGPKGDPIPTQTGELTREALLKTTVLGAGYYENVHQGPAQTALDREIKRLISSLEMGVDQHNMLAKIRREATVGVAEASDFLGGADFPDVKMWDSPHKLVVRAMEMNVGGNLSGSQAFLVVAAVQARNAARLLADYLEDSTTGTERVVTVLKVARTAGQVAEAGLAVTGIVGLARGGVALAGEGGALAADIEVGAQQLLTRYTARNGIHADELSQVRHVRMPAGSKAGGVKPGTSSGAGSGFHKW